VPIPMQCCRMCLVCPMQRSSGCVVQVRWVSSSSTMQRRRRSGRGGAPSR
jgi:hypothetical protein